MNAFQAVLRLYISHSLHQLFDDVTVITVL